MAMTLTTIESDHYDVERVYLDIDEEQMFILKQYPENSGSKDGDWVVLTPKMLMQLREFVEKELDL